MARIKLSGMIGDIRGKLGGSYFQATRSGLVMRNTAPKKKAMSGRQYQASRAIRQAQDAWLDLDEETRRLWDYASNVLIQTSSPDKTYQLSGREAFIKANSVLILHGFQPFSTIITIPLPLYLDEIQVDESPGSLRFQYDVSVPSFVYVELFATRPLNNTINNPGSRYKWMQWQDLGSNVYEFAPAYEDAFGRLPESGEKVFFKWREFWTDIPKLSMWREFSIIF